MSLLLPSNALGSHQHYFHLLLGNLVPLLGTPSLRPVLRSLVFPDAGPLTPLLQSYGISVVPFAEYKSLAIRHGFPPTLFTVNRFGREVIDKSALGLLDIRVNTMSARCVRLFPHDHPRLYPRGLTTVAANALRLHGLAAADGFSAPAPAVVFVTRKPQDSFYDDANQGCEMPTAGAARRSIPNADELCRALATLADVAVVSLEGRPLVEQMRIFATARLVVAQHGAALANLVFCRPGTKVLEIFPRGSWNCFQPLAETFQLAYHRLPTAGPHDAVDVDAFLQAARPLL